MGDDKEVVLVTGGTGFIASWMIMRLLQQGYTVRTTIRPRSDPGIPGSKKDISFLTNLPGASENLHIFDADLNEPDSFEPAVDGCTGVFHVAHPMDWIGKDPEEVVVQRSIRGTLGILGACLKSKTVKRVIYTSSAAAVMFSGNGEDTADESSWSDVEYYKSLLRFGNSYMAAKTRTEKAAIEFAEENGLDLVTVIPSLVVGPFLCPGAPGSVHMALALILGNSAQYRILRRANMVHVDDVASAHIFLLNHPDAKGRYICSSTQVSLHELSDFLSAKYPNFQIPTREDLKDVEGHDVSGLSSKKLLSCGFEYKCGLDEMFDDAVQSYRERGLL
ncbi:vestitone reductase-like [Syzygium oleosum]|uniref:vestitone reductase-like n=1 Tax=Syzygium oleosum TaxID=219896 RepID=UPI0024BAF9A3|nr:vestitone reductase-like [Syzygium oleosum]